MRHRRTHGSDRRQTRIGAIGRWRCCDWEVAMLRLGMVDGKIERRILGISNSIFALSRLRRFDFVQIWAVFGLQFQSIECLGLFLPYGVEGSRVDVGTKVPTQLMDEREVAVYHQIKREEMNKILDNYIGICDRKGVRAEKISKEMDSIEKGVMQFISENKIKWLVMGAHGTPSPTKHFLVYHIKYVCVGNMNGSTFKDQRHVQPC